MNGWNLPRSVQVDGRDWSVNADFRDVLDVIGWLDGAEGEDTGFTSADRNTKVQDVIQSPVFGEYGRLIFPVDQTIPDDLTLEHVESILPWYNDVNPDKTMEIVNYLGEQAAVRSFLTSTRKRKKHRIPKRKIPACFSSAESRAARRQSAVREEALSM